MCHTCCGDGRLDGLSKDCQAADLTEASAQSEVAGSDQVDGRAAFTAAS